MKASLFQLVASGLTLGVMAGAVGIQWYQLQGYDELEEIGALKSEYSLREDAALIPISYSVLDRSLDDLPREVAVDPRAGSAEMSATVEALTEIVSVLQELKDENKELREQIEEANRDASEMRFQLETHSRSFRPLKTGSQPAQRIDHQEEQQHPLLPPKRGSGVR